MNSIHQFSILLVLVTITMSLSLVREAQGQYDFDGDGIEEVLALRSDAEQLSWSVIDPEVGLERHLRYLET